MSSYYGQSPARGWEDVLRNGGASYRESFPRWIISGSTLTSSGVGYVASLPLFAGDVVTYLSFASSTGMTKGTTNGTPHLWAALYDTTKTLITQSTDEGDSSSWGSSSGKTFTLNSPYTVPATGLYYAMMCCVAGTGGSPAQVTLRVATGNTPLPDGVLASQKQLSGTSGSSLTTTAPTGPLTITTGAFVYAVAS